MRNSWSLFASCNQPYQLVKLVMSCFIAVSWLGHWIDFFQLRTNDAFGRRTFFLKIMKFTLSSSFVWTHTFFKKYFNFFARKIPPKLKRCARLKKKTIFDFSWHKVNLCDFFLIIIHFLVPWKNKRLILNSKQTFSAHQNRMLHEEGRGFTFAGMSICLLGFIDQFVENQSINLSANKPNENCFKLLPDDFFFVKTTATTANRILKNRSAIGKRNQKTRPKNTTREKNDAWICIYVLNIKYKIDIHQMYVCLRSSSWCFLCCFAFMLILLIRLLKFFFSFVGNVISAHQMHDDDDDEKQTEENHISNALATNFSLCVFLVVKRTDFYVRFHYGILQLIITSRITCG